MSIQPRTVQPIWMNFNDPYLFVMNSLSSDFCCCQSKVMNCNCSKPSTGDINIKTGSN